jgi:hypothetical protein
MIAMIKTRVSALWIEKAAATIGRPLAAKYSHLDGWTEFRIVNESQLAQFIGIADEAAEYKIVWNNPVPHIKECSLDQLELDLR